MRPLPRRPLLLAAVAVAVAAPLAACGGGSAPSAGGTPSAGSGGSGSGASTAPPASTMDSAAAAAAAIRAGAALTASGGYTGLVEGTYRCQVSGRTAVVAMSAGATSLIIRSTGGTVVSAAYLAVTKDFGGSAAGGLPGSVTVGGGTATLRGVTIPSHNGGPPLVLNGRVTCH